MLALPCSLAERAASTSARVVVKGLVVVVVAVVVCVVVEELVARIIEAVVVGFTSELFGDLFLLSIFAYCEPVGRPCRTTFRVASNGRCVFVAVVLQPAQLATRSVWQGAFTTFVVERELIEAVERHVLRFMRNVLLDAVVNVLPPRLPDAVVPCSERRQCRSRQWSWQ